MPIWDSSQGYNVLRTEFSAIWYPEWCKQLQKFMENYTQDEFLATVV